MATRRNTISLNLDALPALQIVKLQKIAAEARLRSSSKSKRGSGESGKGEEVDVDDDGAIDGPSLYSSPVFQGYSLWLSPSGASLDFLKDVVKDLD